MYAVDESTPLSNISIVLWKVAPALHRPNGMTLKENNPKWHINEEICFALSDNLICQYPEVQSRRVNNLQPFNLFNLDSTLGIGKLSLIVIAFTFL